jgi:hypothetical protein
MTTTLQAKSATNARWISACILVGSGIFVLGLVVSAVFAPEWRVLHTLQAMIYVAVVVLTRRKSAWGFGVGVTIAVFWNSLLLFTSPLITEGTQELLAAIRNGSAPRPDRMLTLLAFGGHILIIFGCLAGFFRTRPGVRQWRKFAAGGVLAICYLVAIVFAVGPPSAVAIFRRLFGL